MEKPTKNGPRRRDNNRARLPPKTETDNGHLSSEPVEEQPVYNPAQTLERKTQKIPPG